MSFRFFDFDDLFKPTGSDVAFSVLPLRLTDDLNNMNKSNEGPSAKRVVKPRRMQSGGILGSMDVSESESDCIVKMELPGVSKDAVHIHYDDASNLLTIEAEKKEETEQQVKEGSERIVHYSELRYGSVSRSVTLPEGVDGENVQCSMENGVLKLVFGKKARQETRRKITIN